jgi:cell division protein FtsA
MKSKLSNFVALDIGSSKIAGIVSYIDKNGNANILSQNLHYSKGIKSTIILDMQDAVSSVIGTIYALEKDYGKTIDNVAISITGGGKSYYAIDKIKLSSNIISKDDIKKLIKKILMNFNVNHMEIIHYFPIRFTLDDRDVENPISMFGNELSCELHIVAANKLLLQNLINCFLKCHIEVSSFILSIYASGLACLTDDEKEHGVIIIDMGAKTTSIGIFLNNKLIYTNYIDMGSYHISLDIAKIFGLKFSVAEKLKVLHGNVNLSHRDNDNIINIDDLDIENIDNITISSKNLNEVINSRAEEILYMIKKIINMNIDQITLQKLVITGGGSMIRGIKELSSTILEKQVRIAKPEIIPGFAETYNPSVYSSSIGMVKHQALRNINKTTEIGIFEKSSKIKKIFMWIKENL